MRRTREFPWGLLVLALPIGGAVFGIHYVATHRAGPGKTIANHDVKIETADENVKNDSSRRPASALTAGESSKVSASADELLLAAANGGQCANLEYPGNGHQGGNLSTEAWSKLMKQFHDSKSDLLVWLGSQKKHFNEEQLAMMEGQVKAIRIQRSPHVDEPDLHWRGTVVLTRDAAGEPLIRVGSGFMTLLERAPARARFELNRVVAQTWSPCELERLHVGKPWSGLLGCLGMNSEAEGCKDGSLSEGGWAISSVIASRTAPPGCTLPAMSESKVVACLKNFPAPPAESIEEDVAQGARSSSLTKVAKR